MAAFRAAIIGNSHRLGLSAWRVTFPGHRSQNNRGNRVLINPVLVPFTSGINLAFLPCATCSLRMNANTEWLSSVRGRFGYTGWGNTWLYATGGVAWANIEYNGVVNGPSVAGSNSQSTISFNTDPRAGGSWARELNG